LVVLVKATRTRLSADKRHSLKPPCYYWYVGCGLISRVLKATQLNQ